MRRHRILHLITRLELGGAQQNTLFCTAHHDRERFEVDLLAGEGGMLDAEARAISDARVELLPYLVHPSGSRNPASQEPVASARPASAKLAGRVD